MQKMYDTILALQANQTKGTVQEPDEQDSKESEGEEDDTEQEDPEQTWYELLQARFEAADLEIAQIASAMRQLHRIQTSVTCALNNLLTRELFSIRVPTTASIRSCLPNV